MIDLEEYKKRAAWTRQSRAWHRRMHNELIQEIERLRSVCESAANLIDIRPGTLWAVAAREFLLKEVP